MLQDMVEHQDQQLSIDEISSPLGVGGHDILEFCESELFPENCEVGSTSNCTYGKNSSSSYQTHFPNTNTDMNNFNTIILDEDDISAAIDFTASSSFSHHPQYNDIDNNNQQQFDICSLNNQLPSGDMAANGYGYGPAPEQWAASYEEECRMSSYIRLKSSQPLIDNMMVPYLPPFSAAFTGAALMLGTDLEFQADDNDTALFIPDNMHRFLNCSTELQGLSSESQHLYHEGATPTTTSALASEITSLEDPTFKVGKLSVEDRKKKIHRYMKKRNERNFSKKIKYACRKTLADSRPRVRGRFAKNDELGEVGRSMGNNNEDEGDDDVGLYSNCNPNQQKKVVVKEEDDLDSTDILAHISGFKCNYPIQSWI